MKSFFKLIRQALSKKDAYYNKRRRKKHLYFIQTHVASLTREIDFYLRVLAKISCCPITQGIIETVNCRNWDCAEWCSGSGHLKKYSLLKNCGKIQEMCIPEM